MGWGEIVALPSTTPAVIPGRVEDANPESRTTGFNASHRPGMTKPSYTASGLCLARSAATSRSSTCWTTSKVSMISRICAIRPSRKV